MRDRAAPDNLASTPALPASAGAAGRGAGTRLRLAAAVLLACQGCSLVSVSGPPDPPPANAPPSCTRRPLVPVIESWTGLAAFPVGLVLGIAAVVPSMRWNNVGAQLAVAGGVLAAGVTLRLSAGVGFARVTRCNRAVRSYERRVEDPFAPDP